MFSHHKAGISTIRQLKIIKEVKKLVDEMQNLYKCNFNRTSSRKAKKKTLKTSRKIVALPIALFSVMFVGAAARD